MDTIWFRQQHHRTGLTAKSLAEKVGGQKGTVFAIMNGRQRMSLKWATAWAEALQVPLELILEKAKSADDSAENNVILRNDAMPLSDWTGEVDEARMRAVARASSDGPGIEIWRVNSHAMALAGLMDGDFILINTNTTTAEHLQPGDVVLARAHGPRGKSMVLRSFEPPVLVDKNLFPAVGQVQVIDLNTLTILGKVIASWRAS